MKTVLFTVVSVEKRDPGHHCSTLFIVSAKRVLKDTIRF